MTEVLQPQRRKQVRITTEKDGNTWVTNNAGISATLTDEKARPLKPRQPYYEQRINEAIQEGAADDRTVR